MTRGYSHRLGHRLQQISLDTLLSSDVIRDRSGHGRERRRRRGKGPAEREAPPMRATHGRVSPDALPGIAVHMRTACRRRVGRFVHGIVADCSIRLSEGERRGPNQQPASERESSGRDQQDKVSRGEIPNRLRRSPLCITRGT